MWRTVIRTFPRLAEVKWLSHDPSHAQKSPNHASQCKVNDSHNTAESGPTSEVYGTSLPCPSPSPPLSTLSQGGYGIIYCAFDIQSPVPPCFYITSSRTEISLASLLAIARMATSSPSSSTITSALARMNSSNTPSCSCPMRSSTVTRGAFITGIYSQMTHSASMAVSRHHQLWFGH